MKKLFIQFYLLLLACFLVMTMLVGFIYRYTAERAGRESMDDMIKSSIYLIRNELRDTAPRNWNKTIENLDFNLSFKLHVVPLDHYQHQLDPGNLKHLQNGEIVALDDKYTIIQRIPHSQYVLAVGPIPYLFYLHETRIFDILLMLFVGVSLALPVFIWMRPHWEDLLRLENAAQRFGQGHLDERIHFDNISSLARLGVAFNQMADNINALVTSKKQLIDGIAHEFRTPLVRLHYRLEMSENLSEAELKALIQDIGQLEALIEELLTCARLDRPRVDLNFQEIDLAGWLAEKLANFRLINPGYQIIQDTPQRMNVGVVDCRLIERVLDNLVNNALRYASQRLRVGLWFDVNQAFLQVEDDGPGIPPEDRQRVFEPFVRLDPSRDRATGGCGLGLAIVRSVAQAFGGQVIIGNSPLGGASVRFCWPLDLPLRQSSVHISV